MQIRSLLIKVILNILVALIFISSKGQTNNFLLTRKIALKGDIVAQKRMGEMYFDGTEVGTNYDSSFYWFNKTAEQGYNGSYLYLSYLYAKGLGVERDTIKAKACFDKVLTLEGSEKIIMIGEWYFIVRPKNNTAFAVYILDQLGRAGYAEAFLRLGDRYYDGELGFPSDMDKAKMYYNQSALMGDTAAIFMMGNIYDYGIETPIDKDKAVYWYRIAAGEGHTGAQINLGIELYLRGGEKNLQEAASWMHQARQSGSKRANEFWNKYHLSQYYVE